MSTDLPRSLAARILECAVGLVLFGVGVALVFAADLGRAPWDVLHEGIAEHTGLEVGKVTILLGLALLVLWFPLRERPGIGTLMNAVIIGAVFDVVEPRLPDTDLLIARLGLLGAGIGVVGIGSALYLRTGLGAGPRDGLMTGLARVTPLSLRVARTAVEGVALVAGISLGGQIGIGTVAFALGIGPTVQAAIALLGPQRSPAWPASPPR